MTQQKMESSKILSLKKHVISEVTDITMSRIFKKWLNNEAVSPSGNQFIAINNSFIFRDNVKTVKSDKYLAFDISASKKYDTENTFIIEGVRFNSHFKIFNFASKYKKIKLENAIKAEMEEIGEVIYTLVGDIKDVNAISESLNNTHFKKITLNPTLSTNFKIEGDVILIKDYVDREQIWDNIKTYCEKNTLTIADNLPLLIDKAITELQKNAFSTILIPKTFNSTTKYLLDKISMVIEDHLKTYNSNIKKVDSDPKAMIEILRISYNFVSDVNKLLILIINLCDLKPIILWLTISKYLDLDNKFKELPFGFSKTKASLKDYESLIKNARNKSFHQLFPFNKSLRFEVEALEKVSVTIFSNYGQKDGNKMTYKDQELYDLLRSFTRVNEQVVSKRFWIKNEEVMVAIYEIINATSNSIKSTR